MDDFYLDMMDYTFLDLCSQFEYNMKLEEELWEWENEYTPEI